MAIPYYSDIDLKGNKLLNGKVNIPINPNDIVDKDYVDKAIQKAIENEGSSNSAIFYWDGKSNKDNPNNLILWQKVIDKALEGTTLVYMSDKSSSAQLKSNIFILDQNIISSMSSDSLIVPGCISSPLVSKDSSNGESISVNCSQVELTIANKKKITAVKHTVYIDKKSEAFLPTTGKDVTSYSPTYDYHPSTKKYVDDLVQDITETNLSISGENTLNLKEALKSNALEYTISGNCIQNNYEGYNLFHCNNHVYGIRRKITDNTNSAWERIGDSVGLVANATKDGSPVRNDFDNLSPWKDIKSCNYDIKTGKVKAWFGDPNFKFDGSNGDVYTHIPDTYFNIYIEGEYIYALVADYAKVGFKNAKPLFSARYHGSVKEDGLLHSCSGLVPTTDKNINQFRDMTKQLGTKFSLLDWRYFILQILYLVEYADYDSQKVLGKGICYRSYKTAIVAEKSTNRIIVDEANGYFVGSVIRIGMSDGDNSIAKERIVKSIENYTNDSGNVKGKAIIFDGEPVNIEVGNHITTQAQKSGQCDSLGMKSGCLINDGYHSVAYRGHEDLHSHIWSFVDGFNMRDLLVYYCKDHTKYISDKFDEQYKPLGYTCCSEEGWATELGFDPDEPLLAFPTKVKGNDHSGMCDYYYKQPGNRVALVDGSFYYGSRAGLWFWNFTSSSSTLHWTVGCRVLIDDQ